MLQHSNFYVPKIVELNYIAGICTLPECFPEISIHHIMLVPIERISFDNTLGLRSFHDKCCCERQLLASDGARGCRGT